MTKQLKLHALQQHKKASRLSRADIQEHKKKGNLIGYFGLAKLGRPPKQALTKTKTTDHAEGNKTQQRPKRTCFARVDWSCLSNFPKLKAAVGAQPHGRRLQQRNIVVKQHDSSTTHI